MTNSRAVPTTLRSPGSPVCLPLAALTTFRLTRDPAGAQFTGLTVPLGLESPDMRGGGSR